MSGLVLLIAVGVWARRILMARRKRVSTRSWRNTLCMYAYMYAAEKGSSIYEAHVLPFLGL